MGKTAVPSALACDVLRIIWGKFIHDIKDGASYQEVAFLYAIYHYAVSDILTKYGINEEVENLFPQSAAFLNNLDQKDPTTYAITGTMRGVVSFCLKEFRSKGLKIESESGCRSILSMKNTVLGISPFEFDRKYTPSDHDCEVYRKKCVELREEVTDFLTNEKRNADLKETRENRAMIVFWVCLVITAAIFIMCIKFA